MTDLPHPDTVSPADSDPLLALDRQYLWHPYAKLPSQSPLFAVASAEGCTLMLRDGRQLIDGMSSWWSTIHGYNHPRLNQALVEQSQRMAHVMFGGLTHAPAVELAQRLATITPAGLEHVFLCDSGSVSVEVAMKMAVQYWRGLGQTRHRFLAFQRGYHGDTLGAMSVCDPVTGMHQMFRGYLPQHLFAEAPPAGFERPCTDSDLAPLHTLLARHCDELAAVIVEPIVQGAGGMRFYSPAYLRGLRQLCDEFGLLLIADEIATGFGRSGALFACDHAGISPDMLCLGKALTGGYLSLAATLCTPAVAEAVCRGESGVFMHGPTFMGNPLACAVANASIVELLARDWQAEVRGIEQGLREGLAEAKGWRGVAEVRVLGAIGVVELEAPVDMARIQPMFVEAGVWVRPFGKLVYLMPPYIISASALRQLCRQTLAVLRHWLQA